MCILTTTPRDSIYEQEQKKGKEEIPRILHGAFERKDDEYNDV